MTKLTAKLKLPSPEDSEAPNGPAEFLAQNERLDLVVPKLWTPKVIAAQQERTNVAYGVFGTADEIALGTLPANTLLEIGYLALWKSSVAEAGRALIYLNSTIVATGSNSTGASPASSSANNWGILQSMPSPVGVGGAMWLGQQSVEAYGSAFVATPMLPVLLTTEAEYTIQVRFAAASGTVYAKERRLWARAQTAAA